MKLQTLQEGGDILRKTQFSKPCEREELLNSKILTINRARMCLEWRTIQAISILCKESMQIFRGQNVQ